MNFQDTPLFFFSVTQRSCCVQAISLFPPSLLTFPERKAHLSCTSLLQAVNSHLLHATPSLHRDLLSWLVFTHGLYNPFVGGLELRYRGTEAQWLSYLLEAWSWQEAQLSQYFLLHMLTPYHDLLYLVFRYASLLF